MWMQLLNNNYQSTCDVGRDVSFDEAMIASVARCVFRVFMRECCRTVIYPAHS